MELFTVTRFDENKIDDDHENKLLKKLLKKAKKRKLEVESKDITEEHQKIDYEISENKSTEHQISNHEENGNSEKMNANNINENKEDENIENEFQILGNDVFKKKQKINMVLPPWLAHPTVISTNILEENENESIEDLEYLSPIIKENLRKMGITRLFPVQKEVVPSILNAHSKPFPFKPKDICVSAPTGSGKTLAFAIPLIQLLMNRVERKTRALVILPVNELALQIFKVLKSLADKTVLSIRLLSKGVPFIKEQQLLLDFYDGNYYSKADIIVTTPGRLVEHLHSTKGLCLKDLKFIVIDEADRIMEQIHFNWLYHLNEHVRKTSDEFFSGTSAPLCLQELMTNLANQPHKMLFSATLSHDPEKLINLKLFQPKLFTTVTIPIEKLVEGLSQITNGEKNHAKDVRGEFVGKYTTPLELTEKICLTDTPLKPLTLFALIKENCWNKFLCFTNSVDSAYRLSKVLDYFFGKQKYIRELSASLTASQRNKVLDLFAKGKIKGLICSDALARGIDIPLVDIVISYDVPRHIKTYIHRIGRTARAGRLGTAITLLSEDEKYKFKNVLADAGKFITEEIKVESKIEEEYANEYTKALQYLQYDIKDKKRKEIIKKSIHKSELGNNKIDAPSNVLEKLQHDLNKNFEAGETPTIIQRRFRKNNKLKKNKKRKT
ncbi:probable ATP-dependent RNA helicase Dbp73D [Condylostylus longicornis]|uniref:probable ATP-dependent RNA helicase Dbp73D n=1 Tax=Condylostylus longicornis TaxID=2530218 RepID=UPI00244DC17B|nr:probable ATP-dependent RNA helicase Dbp73D [Condylostylus longicornis]